MSDLNLRVMLESIEPPTKDSFKISGKRIEIKRSGVEIFLGISGDGKIHLLLSPKTMDPKVNISDIQLKNLSCSVVEWAVQQRPIKNYIDISCAGGLSCLVKKPFLAFGEDLIKFIEAEDSSVEDTLRRVFKRWRRFWSGSESNLPTSEWVRGMLGELCFLELLLEKRGTPVLAVWDGPKNGVHDFHGGTVAFEIKTSMSRPAIVHVSGLSQLDASRWTSLYLVLYRLEEDQRGSSIVDLVRRIESLIDNDDTGKDDFWDRLATGGYRREFEFHYSKCRYLVRDPEVYAVDKDFPKLTKDSFLKPVDMRVFDLRYSIELSGLEMLEINSPRVKEDLSKLILGY